MKKLMMMIAFFSFVAIGSVSAQCTKATSSCCAKKAEGTASASTQVAADGIVKKVANTTEEKSCSKGAAKACCAKDKAACSKMTSASAAEPKREVPVTAEVKTAN
jgi:hypothetical protein